MRWNLEWFQCWIIAAGQAGEGEAAGDAAFRARMKCLRAVDTQAAAPPSTNQLWVNRKMTKYIAENATSSTADIRSTIGREYSILPWIDAPFAMSRNIVRLRT